MAIRHWIQCHGSATVGEKGQVVLPAAARKLFKIEPGEKLLVLGADTKGFQRVILMKSEAVTKMLETMFDMEKFVKEGGAKSLEKMLKEKKKGRKQ